MLTCFLCLQEIDTSMKPMNPESGDEMRELLHFHILVMHWYWWLKYGSIHAHYMSAFH